VPQPSCCVTVLFYYSTFILERYCVAVADGAGAPVVAVGAPGVLLADAPPITITTVSASPKKTPLSSDMRHVPEMVPVFPVGAVIGTDSSVVAPAATACERVSACPPIASPPTRLNLDPGAQAQLPEFWTCHVFVNV